MSMDELITEKVQDIMNQLEKVGLYAVGMEAYALGKEAFDIGDEDAADRLKDGRATISLNVLLKIGDYAWDERNLDPESFQAVNDLIAFAPDSDKVMGEILEEDIEDGWSF